MSTITSETPNGVDVTRLVETIDAVGNEPSLADFTFRASNTWLCGGRSRTSVQGFWGAGQEDDSRTQPFTLDGDEPPVLLGSNRAPNAVEAVLHALASCLAVGTAYNAAAQGIRIRSLRFELEGQLDLRGFLGMDPDVRAGFKGVRVLCHLDTDAPEGRVSALWEHVLRTSPVLDILRNPVPVSARRA